LDKYVFSDLHEVVFLQFPACVVGVPIKVKKKTPMNRIRKLEWNHMEIV
jgi:hypothetical protein